MNKYQVFKAGPKKGQPKTLTDRVVRYLVEGLKFQEGTSKSGKYRYFTKYSPTEGRGLQVLWAGKNGAVRGGQRLVDSVSLTDRVHANMEMWESRLQATVDKCNQVLERTEAEQNINCLDKVIH